MSDSWFMFWIGACAFVALALLVAMPFAVQAGLEREYAFKLRCEAAGGAYLASVRSTPVCLIVVNGNLSTLKE